MDIVDDMSDRWDAETYEKVSGVQLTWGQKVIRRRKWNGNEIVMDAGAGSGALAQILSSILPDGRVYAVDNDPNMISRARLNLARHKNIDVIQSRVEDVRLPLKVDVIFSNAALHWMPSHRQVFANFWQLLKNQGELLIQSGGYGNIANTVSILDDIITTEPYRQFFANWRQPWNFAKPKETEKLLKETGFTDINVHLSDEPTTFAGRQKFSTYVKTVVIWPYLARLPTPSSRSKFHRSFLDEFEDQSKGHWSLDYVRLNISARKR